MGNLLQIEPVVGTSFGMFSFCRDSRFCLGSNRNSVADHGRYFKRPDSVAKHYSYIRTYLFLASILSLYLYLSFPCIHPILVFVPIFSLHSSYSCIRNYLFLASILFLYLYLSFPCIHPILVLILFLYCTYPILVLLQYLCICTYPILVSIRSFFSAYTLSFLSFYPSCT